MRETLVGRDELDAAQLEIARLQTQLEERTMHTHSVGKVSGDSAFYPHASTGTKDHSSDSSWGEGSVTWSSVHAPASQDSYVGAGVASRSVSGASRTTNVEQSADGWWS